VQYAQENGHACPPPRHATLGIWISTQRTVYTKGTLSQDRIDLLEKLKGWSWDPYQSQWHEKYQELVQYAQENGNANPPQRHATLGTWVTTQRIRYSKGILSQDRIDLLEKLNGWSWDPKGSQWQEKYQELVQYAQENGNACPPRSHETLGFWVSKQRSNYKNGKLSEDRINLLHSLQGWVWSVK
jgi:hypothetical protein